MRSRVLKPLIVKTNFTHNLMWGYIMKKLLILLLYLMTLNVSAEVSIL